MSYLITILILAFFLSIILTFISHSQKMNAIEIVNNMGIGWNLANSFDCYDNNNLKVS